MKLFLKQVALEAIVLLRLTQGSKWKAEWVASGFFVFCFLILPRVTWSEPSAVRRDSHTLVKSCSVDLKCVLMCRRSATNNVVCCCFFCLTCQGGGGRPAARQSPCRDVTNRYGWPEAAPPPGPLHLRHDQQVSWSPGERFRVRLSHAALWNWRNDINSQS